MKALLDLVRRHRAGEAVGIYSVCSAHPLVLRAALEHAGASGGYALIEATSNQVNQEGGYTGLRPAQFRDRVFGMADEAGLARERVLLGGDHLGPNAWQSLESGQALRRAGVMIAEYVSAGFRKIHLDCSMSCADDPPVLSDTVVASRTAALCALAEDAWRTSGGEPPVYVVGTEVPVPGGAPEALHELPVTAPAAARATVAAHREGVRRGRRRQRVGARHRSRRPAGSGVRPRPGHRLSPRQGARAQRLHPPSSRTWSSRRTRPTTRRPALGRPGARSLRHSQGGTGADLRAARGGLGARSHRAGVARRIAQLATCGPPSWVPCGPIRRHWRKYYHGAGQGLELQLRVQPQRPHPLLLAGRQRGRGPRAPEGGVRGRHGAARAHFPVPAGGL